jgi:hypothetical protein
VRPQYIGVGLGLLLAVIGAALGQISLVVLGLVLGFIVVAFVSMAVTRANQEDDLYEKLSPESRILARPLKKLHEEMAEAASGQSSSMSPYLSQEALRESSQLLKQSINALLLRDKLMKESRGRYDAEKSIGDLEFRLANTTSEDETTSLKSALDARRMEIAHYERAKQGTSKIESSVKQAEAAMAEMRAKLITSGSTGVADQESDPLREAVGRMHSLSASLTEAQEMLQQ